MFGQNRITPAISANHKRTRDGADRTNTDGRGGKSEGKIRGGLSNKSAMMSTLGLQPDLNFHNLLN